jgi:hypothetical protein
MFIWIKEVVVCVKNRKQLKKRWEARKIKGFKKDKLSVRDLCCIYRYNKELKVISEIMIWWRLILMTEVNMSDLYSVTKIDNQYLAVMAGKRVLNSHPDQNHIIHVLKTVPSLKKRAWNILIKRHPVMNRDTFHFIAEYLPCADKLSLI